MASHDHYPSNKELPRDVGNFCSRLHLDASTAAHALQESWRRPVRHNRGFEQEALYHAASLSKQCTYATGAKDTLGLVSSMRANATGDLDVRYGIEASVRLIPSLMPYNQAEVERLHTERYRWFELWADSMIQQEPELVTRWHRWIWDTQADDTPEGRGDASLLALACSRLAMGLEVFLGW